MRSHYKKLLPTLTTIIVALSLPCAAGAATPVGPRQFKVALDMTPDVKVDIRNFTADNLDAVERYCTLPGIPPRTHEPFPCTIPVGVKDAGHSVTGTIQEVDGTLSGPFTLKCDFVLSSVVTGITVELEDDYTVRPEKVVLTSMRGSGPVGCSWTAGFGAAGSVSGTSLGTLDLDRIPDQQRIAAGVDMDVKVIAGTGFSSRAVGGTGEYAEYYEAPWTPESSILTKLATAAVAPADDGTLTLDIRKASAQTAGIVPLPVALTTGDPRQLRVVAPKGSSCTAKATKSTTVVTLGTASVKKASGETTFKGTLAKKLTSKGTWKLAAACTYKGKALPVAKASVKRK